MISAADGAFTEQPAGAANLARFEYRAARDDGAVERGIVAAKNETDALRLLALRGLLAAELREAGDIATATTVSLWTSRNRMPVAQLALGLRVLSDFLDAGLPVARALSALEEMAPSAWRKVLPSVRAAIRDGKSVAAALADADLRFPRVVIGLIRAGESGMGLAIGARRAAEIMEEAAAARAAIRAALSYPVILLVAGTASLCLLVGVVIPHFASILADLGETLPPMTRALLAMSSVSRQAALPVLAVVVATMALWQRWIASDRGAKHWHGFLLSTPFLGSLRLTATSSRICFALAALLESGVPISAALDVAANASNDAILTARWLEAREQVVRGERLSNALHLTRATTATTMRLARAGEESGRLAAMLMHAARLDREESLRRMRSAVQLLEPAMILLFGALIAFVAGALLQALYGIRPTV